MKELPDHRSTALKAIPVQFVYLMLDVCVLHAILATCYYTNKFPTPHYPTPVIFLKHSKTLSFANCLIRTAS